MAIAAELESIKRAFKADRELAYVWHDNIAMSFFDALPEDLPDRHAIANDGAARFMFLAYKVDTSRRHS